MPSYARRKDASQDAIVNALRKAGVKVWIIGRPCDLLTLYRGKWLPLECKTAKGGKLRLRKDQAEQAAFCEETGVPYVTNDVEALKAVGVLGFGEK
jgi:Holliday junction resolvase